MCYKRSHNAPLSPVGGPGPPTRVPARLMPILKGFFSHKGKSYIPNFILKGCKTNATTMSPEKINDDTFVSLYQISLTEILNYFENMCICLSLSSKGKGNDSVSDERFSVWKKYMFTGCRDQTQTHIDDDEAFIDYSHKGSEKGQQRRTKADNVAFALMSQSKSKAFYECH